MLLSSLLRVTCNEPCCRLGGLNIFPHHLLFPSWSRFCRHTPLFFYCNAPFSGIISTGCFSIPLLLFFCFPLQPPGRDSHLKVYHVLRPVSSIAPMAPDVEQVVRGGHWNREATGGSLILPTSFYTPAHPPLSVPFPVPAISHHQCLVHKRYSLMVERRLQTSLRFMSSCRAILSRAHWPLKYLHMRRHEDLALSSPRRREMADR